VGNLTRTPEGMELDIAFNCSNSLLMHGTLFMYTDGEM